MAVSLLAGPPAPPLLAWTDALLAGIVITHAVTVPFLAIVSSRHRLVELSLSTRTVETYVNRWVRLTGVDNRRQLVAMLEYYYLAGERVVGQQEEPVPAHPSKSETS